MILFPFLFSIFFVQFSEEKIEKIKLVFWLFLFFEFSFLENENGKNEFMS